jgi:biotin transport system substrate-specific component
MLSVALYLAAGAAGLPVFAGGESGAAHLIGPTAGYLWGFLAAAGVAGALAKRGGMLTIFAAMLLGHAVILALGAARLAVLTPLADAVASGVAPFLLGAAVKSLAAAALCVVVRTRK